MKVIRRSTLRMALAMLFILIAALVVTSGRASATNCPYTVSISNIAGRPLCSTDFPMSVTATFGGAISNTTVYTVLGDFTEQTPAGTGGAAISSVTVNGVIVAASIAGVTIPSSCPGQVLHIRVEPAGPNGCPWIYITMM